MTSKKRPFLIDSSSESESEVDNDSNASLEIQDDETHSGSSLGVSVHDLTTHIDNLQLTSNNSSASHDSLADLLALSGDEEDDDLLADYDPKENTPKAIRKSIVVISSAEESNDEDEADVPEQATVSSPILQVKESVHIREPSPEIIELIPKRTIFSKKKQQLASGRIEPKLKPQSKLNLVCLFIPSNII